MVVLSNAPFSAGLSFGTSHRGSNSSCQPQPFTYPSSQYISLDSIHFTRGIFVSPLKFFGVCVYVCELHAHAYSLYLSFACVCACVKKKKEEKKYLFTHMFTPAAMGAWSTPGAAGVTQQGREPVKRPPQ